MLTKVCAGKKKYHFAYGTGKRKDGKGEGELLVRGKKLKKQDVEQACECHDFLMGLCWSSPSGETVFFQATGKKLSQMLVAKMALTAKRVIGKPYDFQLPSPEEEARASALTEGDEDGDSPRNGSPAAVPAAAPPGAPPPPSAGEAARWQGRRKALEALLLAALKAQRGDTNKMRAVFTFAQAKAQAGEFHSALQALDTLEKLLRAAVAAPAAPAAPAVSAAPARAEFSVAKLGKARLEWISARTKAIGEIKRLQAALQAKYQNDPAEQTTLASAVQELELVFDELNEDLGDQLDGVLNASGAQRPVLARVAGATLAQFLSFVETDELMKLLDGNEVLPNMQVTGQVRARLQAIAEALN
jgi:hypothetical protein